MGRSHRSSRSDTEQTEVKRLRYENQKLKKQISQLRKQLSRIDIDRYTNLKEMIEAQAAEDESFDSKVQLEELKQKWMCHECNQDYLRIVIVPRADGVFYIRKCPTCSYRTKLKKYTDGIDGFNSNGELVNQFSTDRDR
jgi:rubrerythrin